MGGRRRRGRTASRPALAQRRRRVARRRRRRRRHLPAGRVGPDLFAHHMAPTFVVLDEIHHAGESATWGTALRAAFDGARQRLAPVGHAVSLGRARDPVRRATTRSAAARPISSTATARRWATASAARSPSACSTPRCAGASTRRRRSPRSPTSSTRPTTPAGCAPRSTRRTPLLPQMLRDADALLTKARAVIPDAAGLVLCDDRAHARATAALLRTIAGEKPVVVVSDEPRRARAHRKVRPRRRDAPLARRGEHGQRRRGRAAARDRRVRHRQAHRPVLPPGRRPRRAPAPRRTRPISSPPSSCPPTRALTACAERVEVELRQQVSDEVGAAYEVEPPPGLARRADFQPLDAQVEPGGMIVAGVHYARAEVDAARRLLRELGQSERALRSVLEFVRRERVGGAGAAAARRSPRTGASSTSAARSTGSPVAGPSCAARSTRTTRGHRPRRASTARWASRRRADAGEAELDAGLAFLRSELDKLARDYPEQAERLRIPGSVDGDRATARDRVELGTSASGGGRRLGGQTPEPARLVAAEIARPAARLRDKPAHLLALGVRERGPAGLEPQVDDRRAAAELAPRDVADLGREAGASPWPSAETTLRPPPPTEYGYPQRVRAGSRLAS